MDDRQRRIIAGLQLLITAQTLQIAAAAAGLLPSVSMMLNGALGVARMCVGLTGASTLRGLGGAFRSAFRLAAADVLVVFGGSIAASVLSVTIDLALLPLFIAALGCTTQVLGFLTVARTCEGVCGLLRERGAEGLCGQSVQVYALCAISALAGMAAQVLSFVPMAAGRYQFAVTLADMIMIGAGGVYIRFLRQSGKTLAVR